jgi:hypothetical protein
MGYFVRAEPATAKEERSASVHTEPAAPKAQQFRIFLPVVNSGKADNGKPPIKKGVGLADLYRNCDDVKTVKAAWQYDWSANPLPCAVENVPMLWSSVKDVGGNSQWIMGFNEPDLKGQANIAAARAAQMWQQIESKFPDRKLLSPRPHSAIHNG